MAQSFLENVSASHLTSSTIRRMYQLIEQGKVDPKFQELVYSITKGLAGKDYRGELSRIFNWMKKHIRYTRDPYGVEMVQDVWATLKRERADCDDFTIILGAAVETMGAPVRIVTVSTRQDREPVHVYPEAFIAGRWTPIDATVAASYPGWKPSQGITDRITWTRKDVGIHGYDEANVEGLGMAELPWKGTMIPVNLTPGVPDNVAHTYADMMPGDQVVARRRQPGAPNAMIARSSDLVQNPAPGNLPYGTPLEIQNFPQPEDIWSFRPRPSIPMKVDPWGKMKPWSKDRNAMLPSSNVSEDRYMSNARGNYGLSLSGISEKEANAVVGAIHRDVGRKVKAGHIQKSQAVGAAKKLVDAVTKGNVSLVRKEAPETFRSVKAIAKARGRNVGGAFADSSMDWIPTQGGVNGLEEVGAARTPATKPHHPASAGMIRRSEAQIRDSSGAFFEEDNSMEWIPELGAFGRRHRHHPARTPEEVLKRKDEILQRQVAQATRVKLRKELQRQRMDIQRARRAQRGLPSQAISGLGDLGDLGADLTPSEVATANSLASMITSTISGTVDAGNAEAINRAVNAGVDAALAVVAPSAVKAAVPATGIAEKLKGWTPALMVVGGIFGIAYLMKKRKGSYRSNPRRRSSRGGLQGLMTKQNMLIALGVGAVYMFTKKSSAPVAAPGAAPAASQSIGSNLLSSLANLFKSPSAPSPATQTAQIMTAAGGLTKAITPLFSTTGPTTQPAPAGSDWEKTLVVDLNSPTSGSGSGWESSLVTEL